MRFQNAIFVCEVCYSSDAFQRYMHITLGTYKIKRHKFYGLWLLSKLAHLFQKTTLQPFGQI